MAQKLGLLTMIVALLVANLLSTASSQPVSGPRRTAFSPLKVGQSVSLKDKSHLYEIGMIDEITPLSHKVVEIGDDYIVLRDEAGVVDTRIPLTAIRAVTYLKIKRK